MRRLAVLLLALLPVSVASAAGPSPLVLYSGPITGAAPDVFVQHVDGTGRISLTGGAGYAGGPVWSPDGSRVVFSSNAATNGSGPGELYVVRADGSGLHSVTAATPSGTVRFSPTWSPDGTRLAYLERTALFGPAEIWVVAADGGTGTVRQLTSDGAVRRSVAWQPHGSLLLFDRDQPAVSATTLWTLDPSTGAEREIGNGLAIAGATRAYWSPDGSHLAFPDRSGRIAVATAGGSVLHELSSIQTVDAPAWSPTGDSIAFAGLHVLPGPTGKFGPPTALDIFVADVATGATRRLTGPFDPGGQGRRDDLPSWSPDGSRLLFRADGYDGLGRAWQMNANGTCEAPVPVPIEFPATLAFQPDVSAAIGAARCVDLRLRATTIDVAVAPNRPATIHITVENDGNERATGVALGIAPAGRATGFVDATLGVIAPGEERVVSATLASPTVGLATAIISATADEVDPTPTNARSTASTSVLNCTIVGTWGADTLDGTPGRDRICGLPGADRIEGGKGADYIDAGNGNDTVVGGPGRDTIITRGGRDVIYARDGALDWIDCGTENDIAIVDRGDHTHHCERVVRR